LIYNLFDLLESELPDENIFINQAGNIFPDKSIPDRSILIQETGGSETAYFQFKTLTLQVIAKDKDSVNARELLFGVDNIINNRFGLILPAVTVNGVYYPAFQTGQISSISRPQSIGFDDNARSVWTANYKIMF
jgi:hypothetical protein